MKFGVADYGIKQWDGGIYDIDEELEMLSKIGFQGIERLTASSPSDAMNKAARFRRAGMDFATVRGPDIGHNIQWTAALGKNYVWTEIKNDARQEDMDTFCRKVNKLSSVCARWGIKTALHNHLGQRVESHEELDEFMTRCPEVNLVFDAGHLAGAGGDPVKVIHDYHDRISMMHIKDVFIKDPSRGLEQWNQRLRFCELGAGNDGFDTIPVMEALVEHGYDGWVCIEHDNHQRDPKIDLTTSYNFLAHAGFMR